MPMINVDINDGKPLSRWKRFLIRIGYYKEVEVDVGETDVHMYLSETQSLTKTFKGKILAHLCSLPFELTSRQRAEVFIAQSSKRGFFQVSDGNFINKNLIQKIVLVDRPLKVKTYSA